MITKWLGCLALLSLLPWQGDPHQMLRINELPSSVYRAAGDSNHAMQRVDDTLQVVWIGRDRFAFPFFAEVDLADLKIKRSMKLTEKRARGKGLRMNPFIGRYRERTWVGWAEEVRRQRRSHFLLNLMALDSYQDPPAEKETSSQQQQEGAGAAQQEAQADPRQIFELGRMLGPLSFQETSLGYFALTFSQDADLDFTLRLFHLGSGDQWAPVEAFSSVEGMRPVMLESHGRLWVYYMNSGHGLFRVSSQDGMSWSEPQEIGQGLATSLQAVKGPDGDAVAWSLSQGQQVQVRLARCNADACSPPETVFDTPGTLGRIVLSSEPHSGRLFLLCSYWNSEDQSQVIEALAEAQGYRGVRLTPDEKYVSASRIPFLYNGENSAFAVWDQTAGREASKVKGGMIAVAEYGYGESRWKTSVATISAGDVLQFAASPLLVAQGDALWVSFVAYQKGRTATGNSVPMIASTGELYLVRVEPEHWEARGAEQAGETSEPARN